MQLLVAMNVIKIIILQHILLLHLWIHEVTCYNECDQNHHFAAHSSPSSLDLWSYLLQWMWSKSSLLQHILFLHLWIYEVTCCNESDWKNVCIFGTMKFLVAINLIFENAHILYLIFLPSSSSSSSFLSWKGFFAIMNLMKCAHISLQNFTTQLFLLAQSCKTFFFKKDQNIGFWEFEGKKEKKNINEYMHCKISC